MLCHQCLIRCSNILSCQKTSLYKCISRFNTTHHFYNDLNFFVIYDLFKIMSDYLLHRISRKISQIQYIFYFQFFSCSLRDHFTIGTEYLIDSGSYCSISKHCYLCHIFYPFLCSCKKALINGSNAPSSTAPTLLLSAPVR